MMNDIDASRPNEGAVQSINIICRHKHQPLFPAKKLASAVVFSRSNRKRAYDEAIPSSALRSPLRVRSFDSEDADEEEWLSRLGNAASISSNKTMLRGGTVLIARASLSSVRPLSERLNMQILYSSRPASA